MALTGTYLGAVLALSCAPAATPPAPFQSRPAPSTQARPAPATNYKQLVTLLGVRQAHGLRKAQKLGVEVPLSGRPEVGPRMGWSAEWRPLRRIDDRQRPLCTNRLQQRIAAMPPYRRSGVSPCRLSTIDCKPPMNCSRCLLGSASKMRSSTFLASGSDERRMRRPSSVSLTA
jgi:hypothetical protein